MRKTALSQSIDSEEKAYSLCLRYLITKSRTSFEIMRYLSKRECSRQIIKSTLLHLRSTGYIDDIKYIEFFKRECLLKGSGPRYVENKLRERGIYESISVSHEEEKEACLTALRKRGVPKEKQKLINYLLRKGFTSAVIFSLIGSNRNEPFLQEECNEGQ